MPIVDTCTLDFVARRGGSYGHFRLWASLGFLLAALGGGLLADRAGVGAAAKAGLGGVALTAFVVSGLPRVGAAPAAGVRATQSTVGLASASAFLGSVVLMQMAVGAYDCCFSMYAQSVGLSSGAIGAAWAGTTLAEVAVMAVSGRIIASVGVGWAFVGALAGELGLWVVLALSRSIAAIAAAQLFHGLASGLFFTAGVQLAAGQASAGTRSTMQGLFVAAECAGGLVGGLIAGRLFEVGGSVLATSAAAVAGAALLVGGVVAAGSPRPAPVRGR
jgi:PPP family 3-phenylpropionic acid transporter